MVQADVIVVSAQVIEFIDIEAVALVSNNLKHPELFVLLVGLALNKPADQLWIDLICLRRVFTKVLIDHIVEKHLGGVFVLPHTADAIPADVVLVHQNRHNLSVEQMRKGPVTKIVHQASDCHIADVLIRDVVVLEVLREAFVVKFLGSLADIPQVHHLFLSQVADAETVRKSSMRRPGKHIIQGTKLVETFEPRIDWVVYVLPNVALKAYEFVVHTVLDSPVVCSIIGRRLHRGVIRILRQRSRLVSIQRRRVPRR